MDRAELQGYLVSGLSFEAIGRLVGLDPSTVSYWARRHGLESPFASRHAARGAIPRDQLAALVEEGLSIRAIAARLDRAPTTVRYWLDVYELRTAHRQVRAAADALPARVLRDCARHGPTEFVRTGCSGRYRCRRCRTEYRSAQRRRLKRRLVAEAGGRCTLCGYSSSPAALQFHHLDPAAKAFNLSAQGVGRSLHAARVEAAKCILVCANCHAELEAAGPDRARSARARAVVRRRRKVKAILVADAGGSCERCGYDSSPAALQFHHRDPAEKAFGLAESGVARSLERCREEARKCALLCANCHAEAEVAGAKLRPVPGPD
jgi:DNA-binding CsgD family transcriptional regulator